MASTSSAASSPSSSDAGTTTATSPPPPIPKRNVTSSNTLQANATPSPSSSSPKPDDEDKSIGCEYYEGWCDEIRFVSYRTAAKLRALQHRTGLVHIDIWNMIEAFRENGLNTMETRAAVKRSRLETLVVSLYGSLSKRLPPSTASAANVKAMASWLFSWILTAFSSGSTGKEETSLRVRTLKTLLATLCSGKLMDKLRYIFSQLADSNGHLVCSRFRQFLKDVSKIPMSVGEHDPSSTSSGSGGDQPGSDDVNIFEEGDKVTVNDFLETMMSDPGPASLSWLLVLHRIANAENSRHLVSCGSCGKQNFRGLRYKSERTNYHLCQNCFWRGKIGSKHKDDVFKEYNTYKGGSSTPTSSRDSSSKKSSSLTSCIQDKGSRKSTPRFPEKEKPLDLSNMIPASPQPSLHQINGFRSTSRYSSMRSESTYDPYLQGDHQEMPHPEMMSGNCGDEEHQLIARYAKQLARQEAHLMTLENIDPDSAGRHALLHSRQLVKDLEKKNREIMRNIHQLREQSRQQQQRFGHLGGAASGNDPALLSELEDLRLHKEDLEMRLSELQNTRRDLMQELQELMKLLKVDPYTSGAGGATSRAELGRPPSALLGGMQQRNASGNNSSVTDVSGLGLESTSSCMMYYQSRQLPMQPTVQQQQQMAGYSSHGTKLLPMMFVSSDGSLLLDEAGGHFDQQSGRGRHDGGAQRVMYTHDEQPADSQGSMSD